MALIGTKGLAQAGVYPQRFGHFSRTRRFNSGKVTCGGLGKPKREATTPLARKTPEVKARHGGIGFTKDAQ